MVLAPVLISWWPYQFIWVTKNWVWHYFKTSWLSGCVMSTSFPLRVLDQRSKFCCVPNTIVPIKVHHCTRITICYDSVNCKLLHLKIPYKHFSWTLIHKGLTVIWIFMTITSDTISDIYKQLFVPCSPEFRLLFLIKVAASEAEEINGAFFASLGNWRQSSRSRYWNYFKILSLFLMQRRNKFHIWEVVWL